MLVEIYAHKALYPMLKSAYKKYFIIMKLYNKGCFLKE
ncbi:hypothetical protein UYSO10_2513 [Kosakonia radicincitans]|nr:hypothetical protein UYSO10_2513 [Kosakonia radicincitans]